MKVRVAIDVLDYLDKPIAQGEIFGDLDLKRGNTESQPVLSVRMRNILTQVQETIYKDSQPLK